MQIFSTRAKQGGIWREGKSELLELHQSQRKQADTYQTVPTNKVSKQEPWPVELFLSCSGLAADVLKLHHYNLVSLFLLDIQILHLDEKLETSLKHCPNPTSPEHQQIK